MPARGTSLRVVDVLFNSENRFAAQQLRIKIRRLLRQHAAPQRNLRHLLHAHRRDPRQTVQWLRQH